MALAKILRKVGLKAKITAATILVIIITTVIGSSFFYGRTKAIIFEKVKKRGRTISENLSYNAKYGVLTEDLVALNELVEGVMQAEDVVYVVIQDETGKTLAEKTRVEVADMAPLKKKALLVRESEISSVKDKSGTPIYNISTPIIARKVSLAEIGGVGSETEEEEVSPRLRGAVQVGLSLETMLARLRQILEGIILLTLFIIGGGIILSFGFVRLIMRPLAEMARAAVRVGSGDLSQTVKVETQDEIGQFARQFNAMTRALKKREQQLEESHKELQRVQKLESLGMLAGGIAHDFNNILTAILGNINFAKMYTPVNNKIYEKLTEAEKASLRAKNLTQQLLTFSKGGAPIKKTVAISELIRDTASFAIKGSNVRCAFFFPDSLWPVEIDEGQMGEVISNLIINADQAMPEGGTIKMRAENITLEPGHLLPLSVGRYVKLSIEDEGVGIAKSLLSKIFDPYFTTKQRGSGLGLAVCYSIIRSHGGYINVESKAQFGTTFYIYLPASEKEVPSAKEEEESAPLVGKGKILLMDDEKFIRDSVGEMLSHIGYKVTPARDGTETLALYRKANDEDEPFDAVIMDLTVNEGMGGREAIKKLLKSDPEARAIVSSGYSHDPIMADFKKYGFKGVIAKPYKIKELHQILQKVMAEKT